MDFTCIFFGVLFTVAGFVFACGKGHIHLSAWKNMSQSEKDKIKIRQYAEVFDMTSNQFHSVISSPINACIPVRIMAALSSSLASQDNVKRINSPFSEMSFL